MWRDVSADESHRPSERDIRITDVETMGIEGNPHPDGGYYTWGIVKIETDSGHYGIGETFRGDEPLDVVDHVAAQVIGENPLDVDRLNEHLNRHYTSSGGIGQSAITAIDTALWDIKGKVLDVPVYELLGGKYRDDVVVYSDTQASAGEGSDEEPRVEAAEEYTIESFVRAARDVVDQGFEVLKFDLDFPTPDHPGADTASRRLDNDEIEHKAAMIEAVRDEIGYDVDLGMDLHWYATVESAVRLGKKLEPYDLAFFEDPVHPAKIDAQVRVRDKLDIPILTGENLVTPANFNELVKEPTLDIAAPDVSMCGGLGELRKIATLCDAYGIPLAPHNLASPVGTIAGVHVGAAIPNFFSLEYRGGDAPWWDDVVTRTGESGPILDNGRIDLPEGPGLGIEIDPDVAQERLTEGSEFIF